MNRRTKIMHVNGLASNWLTDEELEVYLKSPNCDGGRSISAMHIQEVLPKAQAKEYLKEFNIKLD